MSGAQAVEVVHRPAGVPWSRELDGGAGGVVGADVLANETTKILAGIDTHADTLHVAIIIENGKPLEDREFLAVGSGYRKIVDFITSYGTAIAAGVEGTESYGAEVDRILRSAGMSVLEVNRPKPGTLPLNA